MITLAGAALPFPLLVLSPLVLTVFFAVVRGPHWRSAAWVEG